MDAEVPLVNEYMDAMKDDMAKALSSLENQIGTVRTGRASPALLDNVQVNVSSYGAVMPLKQLATVSAPDARLLQIAPWDKSVITDIEKAIATANLGLNPNSDGNVIRVPIPPLTTERRQDMVKQVRRMGEDAKVAIRHARREYNDMFKELESDKEISEDDLKRVLKNVQDATDASVKKVDAVVSAKESEILEV